MKHNLSAALHEVFKHEGGFVDHPKDPGGATNMGITMWTLAAYRGQRVDSEFKAFVTSNNLIRDQWVRNVKAMSKAEASEIYRSNYWSRVRGDELPSGVDLFMFDFAVNSGPSRAINLLQRAVGAKQDGILGNKTMRDVWSLPASMVIRGLYDERVSFLRGLSTWRVFGKGWQRRCDGVLSAALDLDFSSDDIRPDAPKLVVGPAAVKAGPAAEPVSMAPTGLAALFARIAEALGRLFQR